MQENHNHTLTDPTEPVSLLSEQISDQQSQLPQVQPIQPVAPILPNPVQTETLADGSCVIRLIGLPITGAGTTVEEAEDSLDSVLDDWLDGDENDGDHDDGSKHEEQFVAWYETHKQQLIALSPVEQTDDRRPTIGRRIRKPYRGRRKNH